MKRLEAPGFERESSMSYRSNPREPKGDQPGFGKKSVTAAELGSAERGLLTSRQSAYFPAEDFQNTLIITEPIICSANKELPPVSMIRLPGIEGAPTAAVESLICGLLSAGRSGAVVTLKELAREADAARRER